MKQCLRLFANCCVMLLALCGLLSALLLIAADDPHFSFLRERWASITGKPPAAPAPVHSKRSGAFTVAEAYAAATAAGAASDADIAALLSVMSAPAAEPGETFGEESVDLWNYGTPSLPKEGAVAH